MSYKYNNSYFKMQEVLIINELFIPDFCILPQPDAIQ
jgi:hypothetical protein